MKKVVLFVLFLLQFVFVTTSFGQSNSSVNLNSFTFDAEHQLVRLSIKTTESFIVGANRYVLHIGGKYFLRSDHPDGRLDEIIFFIPVADYEQLINQAEIFLVYGFYYENIKQDNEGSQDVAIMGKHWKLGNFIPQKF